MDGPLREDAAHPHAGLELDAVQGSEALLGGSTRLKVRVWDGRSREANRTWGDRVGRSKLHRIIIKPRRIRSEGGRGGGGAWYLEVVCDQILQVDDNVDPCVGGDV